MYAIMYDECRVYKGCRIRGLCSESKHVVLNRLCSNKHSAKTKEFSLSISGDWIQSPDPLIELNFDKHLEGK